MAFEQRSENTSAQNAKAWASTLTPWKTLWPFFTMRTYRERQKETKGKKNSAMLHLPLA